MNKINEDNYHTYMTQEDYNNLIKEIEDLENRLDNARLNKVLNGESFAEMQSSDYDFDNTFDSIIMRLRIKTQHLKRAKIIPELAKLEEKVAIGDFVTISMKDEKTDVQEIIEFKLVSSIPDEDIVFCTLNSKMGKAVYEKIAGDIIKEEVDGKKKIIHILEVSKSKDKKPKSM